MTVGKDVSSLFADVVKNMQTDDIELKKLVYLYLINYAKSQPELVILCVNTFVKVRAGLQCLWDVPGSRFIDRTRDDVSSLFIRTRTTTTR
jgi:hypothetical protein